MNPLQTRFAALRRRLRSVTTFRGVCGALAVLLAGLLVAGVVDQGLYSFLQVDLPGTVRAIFLMAVLAGAATLAYVFLYRPLTAPSDDLSLALRVEEEYPVLNDALASTVQFLNQPASATDATSASLRQEAMNRALRISRGCDFNRVVSTRGVRAAGLGLLGVVLASGILLLWQPTQTLTGLARVLNPFGAHAWPTPDSETRLALNFPQRIGIGQRFVIRGDVTGFIPDKATIEFDGLSPNLQAFRIAQNKDGTGTLMAALDMTQQRRDFKFRVRAHDAVSPPRAGAWHTVEVRNPPRLVNLDGKPSPQIDLTHPAYTELPSPVQLSSGSGNIEAIAGTTVVLRGATDRPVTRVWIEYRPLVPGAVEGAAIAHLGATNPLAMLSFAAGGQASWGKEIAELQSRGDGSEFTLRFRPWLLGTYVLNLQDGEGLIKQQEYDLRVLPDPLPTVTFTRPQRSQSVLPNAEITLQVQAEDDVFAVKSVFVEIRRKRTDGSGTDRPPERVRLYDGDEMGAILPFAVLKVAGNPVTFIPPPVALRPKLLSPAKRWSLAPLGLKEGDVLVLQACADDFNNLHPYPSPGKSVEIELTVVNKAGLVAVLDEAQARLQEELARLREMQERAAAKVIGVEQKLKAGAKLNEEGKVDLAEAEQIQKIIQARVGQKEDEGLRAELARLQQMMKDNKLPSSGTADRIKIIKGELDRLAREQLPHIEPQLTGARRDLEGSAKPATPKTQEQIGKARGHQEQVRQTLDELLKFLEPWVGAAQIRGELEKTLKEQRELQEQTQRLMEELQRNQRPKKLTEDQEGELRRLAQLQMRLGENTRKLVDKLDNIAKDRAVQDPATAERLKQAADLGKKNMVADAMQGIGKDQLGAKNKGTKQSDPNLNLALNDQGKAIETLEQMLNSLEEKRADDIERLKKKLKDEGKNLNALTEKLEGLKRKVADAQKIADPQERAAALKKLGEEERDLQQEIEKKGRELARLKAPGAGKALEEAAMRLGKAGNKLDQGLDPDDDDLKQAQQRLQDANQKLDQAVAEQENELAREQMARIAEQIKGLKERQDKSLEESQRLHGEMLKQSKWTRGSAASLKTHGDSQKSLARETDSLREKLKGALVFELILEKSVKSMEEAAKEIQERFEKTPFRQGPEKIEGAELDDERKADKKIQQAQLDAGKRLQRLLDAMKEELEAAQNKKEEGGGGGDGGGKAKNGIPGDGIPPVAQLKALREEQQDLNDRTRELAERHADAAQLPPEARAELEGLRREQERLFELFQKMATAASGGQGGDQ